MQGIVTLLIYAKEVTSMSMETASVSELYEIGHKYFGENLLVVEVWSEGVRFVWIERGQPDDEASAFLHINLSELTAEKIESYLKVRAGEANA